MTSAHSSTEAAARALSALRERLARATRTGVGEAGAALALAHVDPAAALAWLRAEEGSARALPAEVLTPVLALLVDRMVGGGDRPAQELGELFWQNPESAEPETIERFLRQIPADAWDAPPIAALLDRGHRVGSRTLAQDGCGEPLGRLHPTH